MLNFFGNHRLVQGNYPLKDIHIKYQIGRGNSHVYTAQLNNSEIAIKQIQIKSEKEYKNFLKQIHSMKEIGELSPDMIKYYGYFVTSVEINQYSKRKYAHIVMECAQMNLQDFINFRIEQGNSRFIKEEVLRVLEVLVRGFQRLEACKISHCDIKPENILVLDSKAMLLKLCDVGSCRIIDGDSVQQATVFGTVPFLAPQLIKLKQTKIISSNVFKSDVFSFGLVILYLITFKKFSSKERIEISERAYFQVISEWIKEARELVGFDSRITEVLRAALEFQQSKRPFFKDVKKIFQIEKKKKQAAYQAKIFKLQNQQNQKRMSINQSNYISIPAPKISLFNKPNKISTRTTNIGFPKISRNYDRINISPGHLSPSLSPLLSKRQNSSFGSPQKFNNSTQDFKKIIYITEEDKELIPFEFLNQEEKIFVFFTNGVTIKKADCISVYQPCTLDILYQFDDVEANKLYLQYEKYQGQAVGNDCPVLKIKKIFANFCGAELSGGYRNIFRTFCGNQLEALEIVISNSDISYAQVSELLDRLSGKSLKYLGIVWQNYLMNPEQHSQITEKISKLSIKKLTLIMNQNFIKYQKQSRFLLPKGLQTLYLQYKSNFMEKQISNLSISLHKQPIKQLYLNFSNNNLHKSQCNMLFKSVASLQQLQKLILNLSWNPMEDISYIITSLNYLKNVTSFQIRMHHTGVSYYQVLEFVAQVKGLFQGALRILKLAVDRGIGVAEFQDQLADVLKGFKNLKIDVLGHDNKYLLGIIKKSSKSPNQKQKPTTQKLKQQKTMVLPFKQQQQKGCNSMVCQPQKSGQCQSLFTNTLSYQNYLCLTCIQFSQLSKSEYSCKYCIENCKHKNHNFIRMYQRSRCGCAYSGNCTSQLSKRVCAQDLKLMAKKMYECFKCQRRLCLGCAAKCQDAHREWVDEAKDLLGFQCQSIL